MDIVKQNMLMTSELIKVMKLLEKNKIEAISFKGPVLSQMVYGDITLRQYVDLDILVHEKDLGRAAFLLEEIDYTFDKILLTKILENKSIFHDISLSKNGFVTVELHWRFFSNEFNTGLEDIDLKDGLYEITISKQKLKTFKNEILILYLCIHGAKHNWERIEWLIDISRYIKNYEIDWAFLLNISNNTKTTKILFSTLYLCSSILNLELPIDISEKIKEEKIQKLSKDFESLFLKRFKDSLTKKVDTKNISKIQFDLLEGYRAKSLFLLSLLKPSEIEYQTITLSKNLKFLYYVIRPFNIIKRWSKKL